MAAKNLDIPIGIVGSSALRRYRIKFACRDDYERALGKCDSCGFIEFSDGKAANLIGRLVRKAPDHLLLEVDAAEDVGRLPEPGGGRGGEGCRLVARAAGWWHALLALVGRQARRRQF